MEKLIITVGVPGSGKSTALRSLFPEAHVVSPDHISYDADGHFVVGRLSVAWRDSYAKFFRALDSGLPLVAFDATSLRPDCRGALIAAGRHFRYTVSALYCEVTPEEAKRRNAGRSNKDAVPDYVIERMARDLIVPNAYDNNEFDDVICGLRG